MQPEARVTEGWTWPGSFRLNAEGVGREAKGRIHFFKDQEHLGDPVLALPLTVSPWAGHFACLSLGFLIFKENHTNIGYPKHVYTLEQLVVQFWKVFVYIFGTHCTSYGLQTHICPLNSVILKDTRKILWPEKDVHFHYRKWLARHRQKQKAPLKCIRNRGRVHSSIRKKQMWTELRGRLCMSCPQKRRRQLQKRNGNLGTTTRNACAPPHAVSHHTPGLAFFYSTVLSPAMHDMFQEIKTAPKHTEPKDRHFALGTTSYIL